MQLWRVSFLSTAELHLMFSLMDKVPSGIEPMLKDLEEHIMSAGLADMVASAETITSVSVSGRHLKRWFQFIAT